MYISNLLHVTRRIEEWRECAMGVRGEVKFRLTKLLSAAWASCCSAPFRVAASKGWKERLIRPCTRKQGGQVAMVLVFATQD